MTCWKPLSSMQGNETMPGFPADLSVAFEDDAENELSSQLEEVDNRSGGWSSWSEWSPCSRSCDGGASHQLRTCSSSTCRGQHVRYKICNMQAIVVFCAALAATNAGILAPSASIIQGPSSRTVVSGPDGSVISSVAPGGQIISEQGPAVVAGAASVVAGSVVSAYSAPVVSAYAAPVVSAYATPVVSAYAAPVVSAYSAPVVSAYSVPSVYAGGLVAHNSVDTVVAGPSGTISTSRNVATPTVYAHGFNGLYHL